jgi:hypothetical protein
MNSAQGYLVDTNILLRISQQNDPQNEFLGSVLRTLETQRSSLYY